MRPGWDISASILASLQEAAARWRDPLWEQYRRLLGQRADTVPARILGESDDEGAVDVVRWQDEHCVAHQNRQDTELVAISDDAAGPTAPRCTAWRFQVGREVEVAAAELLARHGSVLHPVVGEALPLMRGGWSPDYGPCDYLPVVEGSQTVYVDGTPQTEGQAYEGADYWFEAPYGIVHFHPGHMPDPGTAVTIDYISAAGVWPEGSFYLALYDGDADAPGSLLGIFDARHAHYLGYSLLILLYFDASAFDPAATGFALSPGQWYWLAVCAGDPREAAPADQWNVQELILGASSLAGGRCLVDNGGRHRPDDWGPGECHEAVEAPFFRLYERHHVLRGLPMVEPALVASPGERVILGRTGGSHPLRYYVQPQPGMVSSTVRRAAGRGWRGPRATSSSGDIITNLAPGRVVYVGDGGALAADAELAWDTSTKFLTVQGQALVSSTAEWPFYGEALTDAADLRRSGLVSKHTTTAQMAAGFAAGVAFFFEDADAVEQRVAAIYAYRDGADDSAGFLFTVHPGDGAQADLMTLSHQGHLTLSYGNCHLVSGQLGIGVAPPSLPYLLDSYAATGSGTAAAYWKVQARQTSLGETHASIYGVQVPASGSGVRTLFFAAGDAGSGRGRLDILSEDGGSYLAILRAPASGVSVVYNHWLPSAHNTYRLGWPAQGWSALYVGDGSAGAPSVTFASETTLGFLRAGSGLMQLAGGDLRVPSGKKIRFGDSDQVSIWYDSSAGYLKIQ